MTHPYFDGPRIKLQQAHKHLSTLNDQQRTYFLSEPFEMVFEQMRDGKHAIKIKLCMDVPDDVFGTAADIIGNIRSSLDLAVSACARMDGATDLSGIYFPFADDEIKWASKVKPRNRKYSDKVADKLSTFRPWKGGDNLLYSINDLANADKHRVITPIALGVSDKVIRGYQAHSDFVSILNPRWDPVKKEMTLMIVGSFTRLASIDEAEIKAYFGFGDIAELKGVPAIGYLQETRKVAQTIINELLAIY